MNPEMATKRSACDRCKTQRLRCLRAGAATDPCARCIRAGANCVTGPARRLGRPRKADVNASGRSQPGQAPARIFGAQGSQCGAPGQPLIESRGVSQSVEATVIWSPSDLMADTFSRPGVTGSPVGVIEAVHSYSSPPNLWDLHDDFQLFFEEVHVPRALSHPEVLEAMNQQQTSLSRNGSMDLDPAPVREDVGAERPDALQALSSRSNTIGRGELRQLASASRLSERITVVISYLNSLTWESRAPPEPCIVLMEQPDKNPMAQALLCSEEFLSVVQSLTPSTPFSDEQSAAAASEIRPIDLQRRQVSPGVPTILLVLSVYSQLRQLFDLLFAHLHRSLGDFSDEVLRLSRVKSTVHVGGLPPMFDMQSNIYVRIVVHIMHDRVQNMERQIGLLAGSCLSHPATPSNGLFVNRDLAPILQRLIEHANNGIPKADSSHVDSLQRNIQKVLERLGRV